MLSPQKIKEGAQQIADLLAVIDDIKVQAAQKEISDAFAKLTERVNNLEAALRASKAETQLECVKETQKTVNSVQGAFYQSIQELAIKVALLEKTPPTLKPPSLPPPADGP